MAMALSSCAMQTTPPVAPHGTYLGSETRLLDSDLVNFRVKMRGVIPREALVDYAECVAAQYAIVREFGFARHLRTNVFEEGGIWIADGVYTISSALPDGVATLDAEVVVQNCAEKGIPTV